MCWNRKYISEFIPDRACEVSRVGRCSVHYMARHVGVIFITNCGL